MNCQDMESKFADYCAGSLDAVEETAAELHITSCPQCTSLLETWRLLETIPAPEPGPGLRAGFRKSLEEFAKPPRRDWRWSPAWGVAFCTATLLIGLVAGWWAAVRSAPQGQELAAMRTELAGMRQMVTLSLLARQSPSERLRGIDVSMQMDDSDGPVLDALLQALEQDPNVNVRLAAVDAVARFSATARARRALMNSLTKQSSPLVQVAIMDQMGQWKDGEAISQLKGLASNAAADEIIRRHAETILRRLRY